MSNKLGRKYIIKGELLITIAKLQTRYSITAEPNPKEQVVLWVCMHLICALHWGCSVIVANSVTQMNIVIPNRPKTSVVHQRLLASLPSLLCYAVFGLLDRENCYKTSLFRIQECEIFSSYMGKLVPLEAFLQPIQKKTHHKTRKVTDLTSVVFPVNKKIFTILV